MLEKEFIPYEEALALKELGFDEPCFGWFTFGHLRKGTIVENKHVQGEGELLAPTYSQAFRFFREKYNIDVFIQPISFEKDKESNVHSCMYIHWIIDRNDIICSKEVSNRCFSYEKAQLQCFRRVVKLIKKKYKIEDEDDTE